MAGWGIPRIEKNQDLTADCADETDSGDQAGLEIANAD
jgi:hypothetical protein